MDYKNFTNPIAPDDVIPSAFVNNSFVSDVTMASMPTNQQIVIIQAPKMQRSFERYASRWAYVCGILQIVNGVCSIILGIANVLTCSVLGIIGYGIWCGTLFVISGSFGIASCRKKTSSMIITHMVMSIISALAAATQFCLGVFSATYDNYSFSPPSTGCYYTIGQYHQGDDIGPEGAVSTDALLVVFAVAEAVGAIIGSAVSCKVICCSSNFVPAQGSAAVVNGLPASVYHQQQFAPASPQGQVIYYVNQGQVTAVPVSNGPFHQQHHHHHSQSITDSPGAVGYVYA